MSGNQISKCKVGQSDDFIKNDHVPVTSFIRTGYFGGYGTGYLFIFLVLGFLFATL